MQALHVILVRDRGIVVCGSSIKLLSQLIFSWFEACQWEKQSLNEDHLSNKVSGLVKKYKEQIGN